MKKLVIALLVFTAGFANAQENEGIKFQSGLSWAQIKAKAKKENRYIFVDTYTTWCGPCKYMAMNIFPQAKVGDFFNTNFINLAVQIDQTKKDDPAVKRFYADAKLIQETYNIRSYPTYLFLNPSGELVHAIYQGTNNADEFIASAKKAFDPASQLITLKQRFAAGKRDTAFLHTLIKTAQKSGDDETAVKACTYYLAQQKNLYAPDNLRLIALSARKSTDPGFSILRDHGDKADVVLGKGKSADVVFNVAFDEEILPIIKIHGQKIYYGGGMMEYRGELNKDVHWETIQSELNKKYPLQARRIFLQAKPMYYKWAEKWPAYTQAVNNFMAACPNDITDDMRVNYAWEAYIFCKDIPSLKPCIAWANTGLINKPQSQWYLLAYSSLQYKVGNKDEAIQYMKKLVDVSSNNNDYIDKLNKMKNGEPID